MGYQLKEYAYNKYSQYGEDGIINRVFELLPRQEEYWCVEFGAWDGKHLSNTYELIANQGWRGVLIEGNKKKFPQLVDTYKGNNNAILVQKLVQFDGTDTLDSILGDTDIPLDFDLLSIDIDGNDYHVWDSLINFNPKLVIVEFNPSIPKDIEFVQEKNFKINQGNSLLSLTKLANSKGYELIVATNANGFFIKKEFFDLFNIKNNSVEALWDTEIPAPRVFQLFDGTLVLTEEFKMHWQNQLPVGKYDLQKLPKYFRFFGDSQSGSLFRKAMKKIHNILIK